MKTRAKKLGMVILCITIWTISFAGLGECHSLDEYEQGDFTYKIVNDKYIGTYVSITGLTQAGQEKEVLIVPQTIEGYPVMWLDKRSPMWADIAIWESDKLTTLYLYDNLYVNTEFHCQNLEKKFMLQVKEGDQLFSLGLPEGKAGKTLYIYSIYYFNEKIEKANYILPANVVYRFNYADSPNNDCFWLDNLEDGEKITYMPKDPTREGYKFAGWYKEEECINKWDFDTDTITAYEYEEYTEETFYENGLYAKWLEI